MLSIALVLHARRGTSRMSGEDDGVPAAEIGTRPASQWGAVLAPRRAGMAESWRAATAIPADAHGAALRRRARRIGLALMFASAALSVLIAYGLWSLVRHAS